MATNVPAPVYGPNGFIAPSEAAILAGVQADINAAFGGGLNPGLSTPQGQLASSLAAIIGNVYDTFCNITNQTNPAFAQGRWQDAIGLIYFLERDPAEPTVVQAVCSGLDGVVIPEGAQAQAEDGNLYIATASGEISGGSVTLPFACTATGPIACPADSLNVIYQAVTGWDSINNPADGVLGNVVESRSAFEERRAASVALNAVGSLPAVQGAVLDVTGILDAYVTENATASPLTIGGVTLAPNSLYVAAIGGAQLDIATAIWSKKAPGCAYNGNTTVNVTDPSPAYSPPAPTYAVTFETPAALPILFAVNITNNAQVPSDAATQIQNAIIAAFAGADGGPRARIGSTIYATRFVGPILALGAWAQVISIQIGSPNNPGATFTGSISGTTLTVSAVSGVVAIGQTLTDTTGDVIAGTTIISGSGTSWQVSNTQTVASETMKAVTPALNDLSVNINQVPTISAANIVVTAS